MLTPNSSKPTETDRDDLGDSFFRQEPKKTPRITLTGPDVNEIQN